MRVFFAFMLIGLMCWVGFSVVFLALWCALRCWRCLFLSLVILLFLSSPSSFQLFFPPPSPIHQSMSVYLILGAGTLLISHTSCPLQCSLLSPLPLPLHLTDPLPPSLAGTPCRTVWRRSIRQSNPESLPSGHSGDRWVTTEDGSGARRRSLIRAYTSSCVHASARVTEFL